MPQALQQIGNETNRAAGRFAVEVKNGYVSSDARPVIATLGAVKVRCGK